MRGDARPPTPEEMLLHCREMAMLIGRSGTLVVAFGGSTEARRTTVHHTVIAASPLEARRRMQRYFRWWPSAKSIVVCDVETGRVWCAFTRFVEDIAIQVA